MNLNRNPSKEQLREILRARDDAAGHHVLWIKKNRDVALSRLPKNQMPVSFEKIHPEMQVRCETFQAGNEYVGPEAADDEERVAELFDRLMAMWP